MTSPAIIGVDCATQPKKCGIARGRIDGTRVVVEQVALGSDVASVSQTIASWVVEPTLIAIDAPLGWPHGLARELAKHRAGQAIESSPAEMFNRLTDRFLHARIGKKPLEVGADRIARTAHAALTLLRELRERLGREVALQWSPSLLAVGAIEVYPAATLLSRKLDIKGYKASGEGGIDARRRLLDSLESVWELRVDRALLETNDDRLDAAVCLIAGADFLNGRCFGPKPEERAQAEKESWIWCAG